MKNFSCLYLNAVKRILRFSAPFLVTPRVHARGVIERNVNCHHCVLFSCVTTFEFIRVFVSADYRRFTGTLCESDISECESEPCQNGGTCDDSAMLDHYSCECPFEYYGDNCETGTALLLMTICTEERLCS